MDRKEKLLELSGQIVNGIMSSDGTLLTKLFDRTLHEETAKTVVDLAEKILEEINKRENF